MFLKYEVIGNLSSTVVLQYCINFPTLTLAVDCRNVNQSIALQLVSFQEFVSWAVSTALDT